MNEALPEPDFRLDGGQAPCYYGSTVARLMAAERKHWRTLLSRQHVLNGSCPDAENWHARDPECPACRALGEWRPNIKVSR